MIGDSDTAQAHAALICARVETMRDSAVGRRIIIAIAGPPASGKSTLAEAVVSRLNGGENDKAALLGMDGYHLDNRVLDARGLRQRKGAPETFDAGGYCAAIKNLATTQNESIHPVFDRARDIAIAGALVIAPETRIIITEGNYLLLDKSPWNSLAPYFALTVFLKPPLEVIRARILQRWRDHGFDTATAQTRAEDNDLPNARLVLEGSRKGDLEIG